MKQGLKDVSQPDRFTHSVDDLLVQSPTEEEHRQALSEALQCLQQAGLKINNGKAQLAWRKVTFLGLTVGEEERSNDHPS